MALQAKKSVTGDSLFKLANKMIFEFFVEHFFVSHKFYVFIVVDSNWFQCGFGSWFLMTKKL
jgi:hypothetical protein